MQIKFNDETARQGVVNDPLGQPTVSAGSENLFCFV